MSELVRPIVERKRSEVVRGEAFLLWEMPGKLGRGQYADLGTFCGLTASMLARGLKDRGLNGKVTTVDLFTQKGLDSYSRIKSVQNTRPVAEARFKFYDVRDRVNILEMDIVQAAEKCKDMRFKFIFIDADHAYESVKADFDAWSPLLKENGRIGFHDTNMPEVDRLMKELESGWVCVEHQYSTKIWERK